jgi:tetratricopeptide (TPR) repeat protein
MRVLTQGQEALFRLMLAPELPSGWVFAGIQIERDSVRARYARETARAEVHLEHSTAAIVQKGSIATATLRLNLRVSAGASDAAALFKSVLRAVRAHEHELQWMAPADGGVVERFRELADRGRVREALDLAEQSPAEPRLALAAARLRVTFHDNANAARDARHALTAGSISDRLIVASILARTGHVEEALDVARAIACDARVSAAVLADVAALHRTVGDHEAAIGLYQRSLAIAGDTPRTVLELGTYCAWRGDSTGARQHARMALDVEPARAHGLLGIADALEGSHDRALARFEHALSLRPLDAALSLWRAECFLHLGELERAREEAHRARELAGDDHVPALLLRAAILSRLDVQDVVDPVLADAMLMLSPSEPSNWPRALNALRGNRGESTTYVDDQGALRQLVVKPAARTAAKHALWRFVATASTEEAERDFERVHAMYPGVPEPYNYRGELWLYAGDFARARSCFEQALALYSRSRWAFIGLSAVELLEGRPGDSLATLARGIELAGGPGPTAYVYRGEAHLRLGDLTAARADLEHAVQLNPLRIGAWVNLALLHADERDDEGLARTIAILRTRAPGLVADAAEGGGSGDVDLLHEMLRMLRGNRASTCVTYFTRHGTLRTVPPYREPR